VYFTATSFLRTIGSKDRAQLLQKNAQRDSPCCREKFSRRESIAE